MRNNHTTSELLEPRVQEREVYVADHPDNMTALTEEGKKKCILLFPGHVWCEGKLLVPLKEE